MKVDLRSDTVTKPSPGMLDAMFEANVGDDVYHEDETVNELEYRLAKHFGMDRALFFPSGTMANQAAVKLHTNPGEQVICDAFAHIYNYEGGGLSFNSGVSCKLIKSDNGIFTADQVEAAINPPDFYHSPLSRLVEVENTTNKGGGACWDIEALREIKAVCTKHRLGFHLDGARLWNAMVYKNQNPKTYGELFDTISVCLSKGLGCPVGSVLIGSDALMKSAIRIRKILGGGMRQIGYLAAAGLYALEHNIERLAEDHKKALELEQQLQALNYIERLEPVETNIVIFYLKPEVSADAFTAFLAEQNIRISAMGEGKWRMVTHLDYTTQQHEFVLDKLKAFEN